MNSKKLIKLISVLLMLAVVFAAAGCSTTNDENIDITKEPLSIDFADSISKIPQEVFSQETSDKAYQSSKDITIDGCFRIMSVGNVDGKLAVVLRNISNYDIRYAVLKVLEDDKELSFTVTTAFKDSVTIAFEDSGAVYSPSKSYSYWSISERIDFDSAISMHSDKLKITTSDNLLEIENISKKNIDSDIYVYYKSTRNGCFYGGETYRVKFSALKSGETSQTIANHFYKDSSVIVFVDIISN